jgi:hypothetical protein
LAEQLSASFHFDPIRRLNHLTSGDEILTGDVLNLFPFSVGQADYGAKVEVARG